MNTIREALEQPQAVARGMNVTFEESGGRRVSVAGDPIRFVGEPPFPQRPPVPRGADSAAVLKKAGYSDAQIAALKAAGVTGGGS